MINPRKRSYSFVFRAAAFITLCAFLFTNTASAQIPLPALPEPAVNVISAKGFKIPEALGTVETEYKGASGKPWVIYIQDAHSILDAQKNIQDLIGYLQKEYSVDLVAVEGAKGKLDPTLLKTFPDPFVKEQVMRQYWQRAELSGGELASIFSKDETGFYGIENGDLYKENYQSYLKAVQQQPRVQNSLKQWRAQLDDQRKQTYGQALNEFHKTVADFREEKIGLADLFRYFKTHHENASLEKYPHLRRLFSVLSREASKDEGENLDIALRRMADGFKKKVLPKLSQKKAMEFNQAYQDYASSQSDAGTFLRKLLEIAKSSGFSPKLTPEMKKLLGSAEMLSHIKGTRLFEELESYIAERQNALIKTSAEKTLAETYDRWQLYQNLSKFELNRGQWEQMKTLQENAPAERGEIQNEIQPFLGFYENARKRDRVFHENLESLMAKRKSQSAVVLTGGFHARGFEEELKASGSSYAVILPKMNSLQGQELYSDIMQGKFSFKTDPSETFYEAFMRNASLSLVSALNEPDFRRNLKLWRDEVIRQLAREGRLSETSRYTRYLDDLFKVYHDKFSGRNPKSKEEVLKAVEEELKKIRKETSEKLWTRFEIQFQGLKTGLRELGEQKNLSKDSFTSLWQRVTGPQTAGLSKIALLTNELSPSFFALPAESAGLPAGTGYTAMLEDLAKDVQLPKTVRAEARVLADEILRAESLAGQKEIKNSPDLSQLMNRLSQDAIPSFAAEVLAAVKDRNIPEYRSESRSDGMAPTHQTDAEVLEDIRDIDLAGISGLKLPFDPALKGGSLLLVGPGTDANEVRAMAKKYPELAQFHIMDPFNPLADEINQARRERSITGGPQFVGHQAKAQDEIPELKEKFQMIFMANVADPRYVPAADVARQLAAYLVPGGILINAGQYSLEKFYPKESLQAIQGLGGGLEIFQRPNDVRSEVRPYSESGRINPIIPVGDRSPNKGKTPDQKSKAPVKPGEKNLGLSPEAILRQGLENVWIGTQGFILSAVETQGTYSKTEGPSVRLEKESDQSLDYVMTSSSSALLEIIARKLKDEGRLVILKEELSKGEIDNLEKAGFVLAESSNPQNLLPDLGVPYAIFIRTPETRNEARAEARDDYETIRAEAQRLHDLIVNESSLKNEPGGRGKNGILADLSQIVALSQGKGDLNEIARLAGDANSKYPPRQKNNFFQVDQVNIKLVLANFARLTKRIQKKMAEGRAEAREAAVRSENRPELGTPGTGAQTLKPTGLLARGVILTKEHYYQIRTEGFMPPGGTKTGEDRFPDKVKMALSFDGKFRSSALNAYGPANNAGPFAAFIINPEYVRSDPGEFQAGGKFFNSENIKLTKMDFHSEGIKMLGLKPKQIAGAMPDEVHADSVPPQAISGIIARPEMIAEVQSWDNEYGFEPLNLYPLEESSLRPNGEILAAELRPLAPSADASGAPEARGVKPVRSESRSKSDHSGTDTLSLTDSEALKLVNEVMKSIGLMGKNLTKKDIFDKYGQWDATKGSQKIEFSAVLERGAGFIAFYISAKTAEGGEAAGQLKVVLFANEMKDADVMSFDSDRYEWTHTEKNIRQSPAEGPVYQVAFYKPIIASEAASKKPSDHNVSSEDENALKLLTSQSVGYRAHLSVEADLKTDIVRSQKYEDYIKEGMVESDKRGYQDILTQNFLSGKVGTSLYGDGKYGELALALENKANEQVRLSNARSAVVIAAYQPLGQKLAKELISGYQGNPDEKVMGLAVVVKGGVDGAGRARTDYYNFLMPERMFNDFRPMLEKNPRLLFEVMQRRAPAFFETLILERLKIQNSEDLPPSGFLSWDAEQKKLDEKASLAPTNLNEPSQRKALEKFASRSESREAAVIRSENRPELGTPGTGTGGFLAEKFNKLGQFNNDLPRRSESRIKINKADLMKRVAAVNPSLYGAVARDLENKALKKEIILDMKNLLRELESLEDYSLSEDAVRLVNFEIRIFERNFLLTRANYLHFAALYYLLNHLFYPKELRVDFSKGQNLPVLVDNLKRELHQSPLSKTRDFSAHLDIARKIRPGVDFLRGVSDAEIKNSDLKLRSRFLSELEWRVFLPLGIALVPSAEGAGNRYANLKVNRFRARESYLGHSLYSADIDESAPEDKSAPRDSSAYASANGIFFLKKIIREKAELYWDSLAALTPNEGEPSSPIESLLIQTLKGMNAQSPAEKEQIYLNRIEQEERRHASDYIFAEILSGEGFDFRFKNRIQSHVLRAILRPGSRMEASALGEDALNPSGSIEVKNPADAYVEFAGSWGSAAGRINRIWETAQKLPESERDAHYSEMVYVYLESLLLYHNDLIRPAAAEVHKKASNLALLVFGEDQKLFNGINRNAIALTLGGSEVSMRDKALKARDVFNRIYAAAFYTDAEREQMVKAGDRRETIPAGNFVSAFQYQLPGGKTAEFQDAEALVLFLRGVQLEKGVTLTALSAGEMVFVTISYANGSIESKQVNINEQKAVQEILNSIFSRAESRGFEGEGEAGSLFTVKDRLARVDPYLMSFFKKTFFGKNEIKVTEVGTGMMPYVLTDFTRAFEETFPGKAIKMTGLEIQDVKKRVTLKTPWSEEHEGKQHAAYYKYQSLFLDSNNKLIAVVTADGKNAVSAGDLTPETKDKLQDFADQGAAGLEGYTLEIDPWGQFLQEQKLKASVSIQTGNYETVLEDQKGTSDVIRVFNIPTEINFQALSNRLADGGYAVVGYSPYQTELPMEKFVIYQKIKDGLVPVQYAFSTFFSRNTGAEWIDKEKFDVSGEVLATLGFGQHAWAHSAQLSKDFIPQGSLNSILMSSFKKTSEEINAELSGVMSVWKDKLSPYVSIEKQSNIGGLLTFESKIEQRLKQFDLELRQTQNRMSNSVYQALGFKGNNQKWAQYVRGVIFASLRPFAALWTSLLFSMFKKFLAFSDKQVKHLHETWMAQVVNDFNQNPAWNRTLEATLDPTTGLLVLIQKEIAAPRSESRSAAAEMVEILKPILTPEQRDAFGPYVTLMEKGGALTGIYLEINTLVQRVMKDNEISEHLNLIKPRKGLFDDLVKFLKEVRSEMERSDAIKFTPDVRVAGRPFNVEIHGDTLTFIDNGVPRTFGPEDKIKVGRNNTPGMNDIVINNAWFSGQHFEFQYDDENRRWTIQDLNSKNGIVVDGLQYGGANTGSDAIPLNPRISQSAVKEENSPAQTGLKPVRAMVAIHAGNAHFNGGKEILFVVEGNHMLFPIDKVMGPKDVIRGGRNLDRSIVLQGDMVSRNHFELRYAERGWEIQDVGSSNGTFLGRRSAPIQKNNWMPLFPEMDLKKAISKIRIQAVASSIPDRFIDHAMANEIIHNTKDYQAVLDADRKVLEDPEFMALTDTQRKLLFELRALALGLSEQQWKGYKEGFALPAIRGNLQMMEDFNKSLQQRYPDSKKVFLLGDMAALSVLYPSTDPNAQAVYLGRNQLVSKDDQEDQGPTDFWFQILGKKIRDEQAATGEAIHTENGYLKYEQNMMEYLHGVFDSNPVMRDVETNFLSYLEELGLVDNQGKITQKMVLIDGPEYQSMLILAKSILTHKGRNDPKDIAIYAILGKLSDFNTFSTEFGIDFESFVGSARPATALHIRDEAQHPEQYKNPQFVPENADRQFRYYLNLHEAAKMRTENRSESRTEFQNDSDSITPQSSMTHLTRYETFEKIVRDGFYNGLNYKTFLPYSTGGASYPTYGDSTQIEIVFNQTDLVTAEYGYGGKIEVLKLNEKSRVPEEKLEDVKRIVGEAVYKGMLRDGKGAIGYFGPENINFPLTIERNKRRVEINKSLTEEAYQKMISFVLGHLNQTQAPKRIIEDVEAAILAPVSRSESRFSVPERFSGIKKDVGHILLEGIGVNVAWDVLDAVLQQGGQEIGRQSWQDAKDRFANLIHTTAPDLSRRAENNLLGILKEIHAAAQNTSLKTLHEALFETLESYVLDQFSSESGAFSARTFLKPEGVGLPEALGWFNVSAHSFDPRTGNITVTTSVPQGRTNRTTTAVISIKNGDFINLTAALDDLMISRYSTSRSPYEQADWEFIGRLGLFLAPSFIAGFLLVLFPGKLGGMNVRTDLIAGVAAGISALGMLSEILSAPKSVRQGRQAIKAFVKILSEKEGVVVRSETRASEASNQFTSYVVSFGKWKITQPFVVQAIKSIQEALNGIFKILGLSQVHFNWANTPFNQAHEYVSSFIEHREAIRDKIIRDLEQLGWKDGAPINEGAEYQLKNLFVTESPRGLPLQGVTSAERGQQILRDIGESKGLGRIASPASFVVSRWLTEKEGKQVTREELKAALSAFIDAYLFFQITRLKDFSRGQTPLKNAVTQLKQHFDNRPDQWPNINFSETAILDSRFDTDEPGMVARLADRVSFKESDDAQARKKRVDLAMRVAIRVARHLRALRFIQENNRIQYDANFGIATFNGADYSILISLLVPLLQTYAQIKDDSAQKTLKRELVEVIYAGLSADPDIFLNFKNLETFETHPEGMASPVQYDIFPSRIPETLKQYEDLLTAHYKDLRAEIKQHPVIQESLKHGGHLGSSKVNGPRIEELSIVYQLLHPDAKGHFFEDYNAVLSSKADLAGHWRWLDQFESVGRYPDEIQSGRNLEAERAALAFDLTLSALENDPSKKLGRPGSRADALSRERPTRSEARSSFIAPGKGFINHVAGFILPGAKTDKPVYNFPPNSPYYFLTQKETITWEEAAEFIAQDERELASVAQKIFNDASRTQDILDMLVARMRILRSEGEIANKAKFSGTGNGEFENEKYTAIVARAVRSGSKNQDVTLKYTYNGEDYSVRLNEISIERNAAGVFDKGDPVDNHFLGLHGPKYWDQMYPSSPRQFWEHHIGEDFAPLLVIVQTLRANPELAAYDASQVTGILHDAYTRFNASGLSDGEIQAFLNQMFTRSREAEAGGFEINPLSFMHTVNNKADFERWFEEIKASQKDTERYKEFQKILALIPTSAVTQALVAQGYQLRPFFMGVSSRLMIETPAGRDDFSLRQVIDSNTFNLWKKLMFWISDSAWTNWVPGLIRQKYARQLMDQIIAKGIISVQESKRRAFSKDTKSPEKRTFLFSRIFDVKKLEELERLEREQWEARFDREMEAPMEVIGPEIRDRIPEFVKASDGKQFRVIFEKQGIAAGFNEAAQIRMLDGETMVASVDFDLSSDSETVGIRQALRPTGLYAAPFRIEPGMERDYQNVQAKLVELVMIAGKEAGRNKIIYEDVRPEGEILIKEKLKLKFSGEVLTGDLNDEITSVSIERNSVRSKGVTLNIPGNNAEDQSKFLTQTWKSPDQGWLSDDVLVRVLTAESHQLKVVFTRPDGTVLEKKVENDLTHELEDQPVQLEISLTENGKVMTVESPGVPGISGFEMFRGVLRWLQDMGIPAGEIPSRTGFLPKLLESWQNEGRIGADNQTRLIGTGPAQNFYFDLGNTLDLSKRSESREETPVQDGWSEVEKWIKLAIDEGIVNAVQAAIKTRSAEPLVQIRLENIAESLELGGPAVVISIKDNGKGLNPAQLREVARYYLSEFENDPSTAIFAEEAWLTALHHIAENDTISDRDITTFRLLRPASVYFSAKNPVVVGTATPVLDEPDTFTDIDGTKFREFPDPSGQFEPYYASVDGLGLPAGRGGLLTNSFIREKYKGEILMRNDAGNGFELQIILPAEIELIEKTSAASPDSVDIRKHYDEIMEMIKRTAAAAPNNELVQRSKEARKVKTGLESEVKLALNLQPLPSRAETRSDYKYLLDKEEPWDSSKRSESRESPDVPEPTPEASAKPAEKKEISLSAQLRNTLKEFQDLENLPIEIQIDGLKKVYSFKSTATVKGDSVDVLVSAQTPEGEKQAWHFSIQPAGHITLVVNFDIHSQIEAGILGKVLNRFANSKNIVKEIELLLNLNDPEVIAGLMRSIINENTGILPADSIGHWNRMIEEYEQAESKWKMHHLAGLKFSLAQILSFSQASNLKIPTTEELLKTDIGKLLNNFGREFQLEADVENGTTQLYISAEQINSGQIIHELRSFFSVLDGVRQLSSAFGKMSADAAGAKLGGFYPFLPSFFNPDVSTASKTLDFLNEVYGTFTTRSADDSKKAVDTIIPDPDMKSMLTRMIELNTRIARLYAGQILGKISSEASDDVPVNDILRAIAQMWVKGNNISLNLDGVPEETVYASIREVAYFEVITNVIKNATEAVSLLQGKRNGVVTVSFKLTDKGFVITIEDNGPGMPQELVDRIKEGKSFTTKGIKGTGVGMPTSRQHVIDAGGTWDVWSQQETDTQPGKTIFTINLPLRAESRGVSKDNVHEEIISKAVSENRQWLLDQIRAGNPDLSVPDERLLKDHCGGFCGQAVDDLAARIQTESQGQADIYKVDISKLAGQSENPHQALVVQFKGHADIYLLDTTIAQFITKQPPYSYVGHVLQALNPDESQMLLDQGYALFTDSLATSYANSFRNAFEVGQPLISFKAQDFIQKGAAVRSETRALKIQEVGVPNDYGFQKYELDLAGARRKAPFLDKILEELPLEGNTVEFWGGIAGRLLMQLTNQDSLPWIQTKDLDMLVYRQDVDTKQTEDLLTSRMLSEIGRYGFEVDSAQEYLRGVPFSERVGMLHERIYSQKGDDQIGIDQGFVRIENGKLIIEADKNVFEALREGRIVLRSKENPESLSRNLEALQRMIPRLIAYEELGYNIQSTVPEIDRLLQGAAVQLQALPRKERQEATGIFLRTIINDLYKKTEMSREKDAIKKLRSHPLMDHLAVTLKLNRKAWFGWGLDSVEKEITDWIKGEQGSPIFQDADPIRRARNQKFTSAVLADAAEIERTKQSLLLMTRAAIKVFNRHSKNSQQIAPMSDDQMLSQVLDPQQTLQKKLESRELRAPIEGEDKGKIGLFLKGLKNRLDEFTKFLPNMAEELRVTSVLNLPAGSSRVGELKIGDKVKLGNSTLELVREAAGLSLFDEVSKRKFAFNEEQTIHTAGRDDDGTNTIVLADSLVSRNHAAVVLSSQAVIVFDLNSTNGTKIIPRSEHRGPEKLTLTQRLTEAARVYSRVRQEGSNFLSAVLSSASAFLRSESLSAWLKRRETLIDNRLEEIRNVLSRMTQLNVRKNFQTERQLEDAGDHLDNKKRQLEKVNDRTLTDSQQLKKQNLLLQINKIHDDFEGLISTFKGYRSEARDLELSESQKALKTKIIETINQSADKKIAWEKFQELSNFDPEFGYYTSGAVQFGATAKADGMTFPTNRDSHTFIATMSLLFFDQWLAMGGPAMKEKFTILEQGGGDGLMARNILNFIRNDIQDYVSGSSRFRNDAEALKKAGDFYSAVNYRILDISPELQKRQQKTLTDAGHAEHFVPAEGAATRMGLKDNEITGVLFSNELPDAFPAHLVVKRDGALKEVFVTVENGEFKEMEADLAPETAADIEKYVLLSGRPLEADRVTPINLHLFKWMEEADRVLKKGFVVTVDYGYTEMTSEFSPARGVTVYNMDGVERLIPGIDLTHNIDFVTLNRIANQLGLKPEFLEDIANSPTLKKLFPVMMNKNQEEYILVHSKGLTDHSESRAPRSEFRNESTDPASFLPSLSELGELDVKGLTTEKLEAMVLAAAQKKRSDFDAEFNRVITALMEDLKKLQDQDQLDTYLQPAADDDRGNFEALLRAHGLQNLISSEQVSSAASAILEIMIFGENSQQAVSIQKTPLDLSKLKAATQEVRAATDAFVQAKKAEMPQFKVSFIIDHPDTDVFSIVEGDMRKLNDEGILEDLAVLVEKGGGIQFNAGKWHGLARPASYEPELLEKVIKQTREMQQKMTERKSVVLFSGSKKVPSLGDSLVVAMKLKEMDPQEQEYINALTTYLAVRFAGESLKRQQELLDPMHPEKLKEFINEDLHTAGMLSLEGGILSVNISALTARFAAAQAAQRAA